SLRMLHGGGRQQQRRDTHGDGCCGQPPPTPRTRDRGDRGATRGNPRNDGGTDKRLGERHGDSEHGPPHARGQREPGVERRPRRSRLGRGGVGGGSLRLAHHTVTRSRSPAKVFSPIPVTLMRSSIVRKRPFTSRHWMMRAESAGPTLGSV